MAAHMDIFAPGNIVGAILLVVGSISKFFITMITFWTIPEAGMQWIQIGFWSLGALFTYLSYRHRKNGK
jgi:hypothetical protein